MPKIRLMLAKYPEDPHMALLSYFLKLQTHEAVRSGTKPKLGNQSVLV